MIKQVQMLRFLRLATGLGCVAAMAGCSSPTFTSASTTVSNLVMFQSTTVPKPTGLPTVDPGNPNIKLPDAEMTCPPVIISDSGAALRSYGGQVGDSQAVRNQLAINDVARECTNSRADGGFTLKIGVQGRVVIGPAGGPGTYQANLRMVVKRSGKVVASRVVRVGATISSGQGGAEFVHVEENIMVPAGKGEPDIEVSLDNGGAARTARRR